MSSHGVPELADNFILHDLSSFIRQLIQLHFSRLLTQVEQAQGLSRQFDTHSTEECSFTRGALRMCGYDTHPSYDPWFRKTIYFPGINSLLAGDKHHCATKILLGSRGFSKRWH